VITTPVSYPQWGRTALHKASHAQPGPTAVVVVLLKHGAHVHTVDQVGGCGVLLDGSVRGVHHVLYMLDQEPISAAKWCLCSPGWIHTCVSVLMALCSNVYHI